MKIDHLCTGKQGGRARVEATVTWEDCDRPSQTVFYETDEAFSDALTCNPHAFLVGAVMPAMYHGERRVAIDEAICPELRNGLVTAMGWMSEWYGPTRRPIRIETEQGQRFWLFRQADTKNWFLHGVFE